MPEGGSASGADDNASGCVGVMMAARRMAAARLAGISFERTVRFVTFTGEEYDFLGSIAYARACSQRGEKINRHCQSQCESRLRRVGIPHRC